MGFAERSWPPPGRPTWAPTRLRVAGQRAALDAALITWSRIAAGRGLCPCLRMLSPDSLVVRCGGVSCYPSLVGPVSHSGSAGPRFSPMDSQTGVTSSGCAIDRPSALPASQPLPPGWDGRQLLGGQVGRPARVQPHLERLEHDSGVRRWRILARSDHSGQRLDALRWVQRPRRPAADCREDDHRRSGCAVGHRGCGRTEALSPSDHSFR